MEDVVYRATLDAIADVPLDKLETRHAAQMFDVRNPPGEQVIESHDRISFTQQRIAQMRSQKARWLPAHVDFA